MIHSKYFRVFICQFILLLYFIIPTAGYAGDKEEYEEALKLYLAASACCAAYTDRTGNLAFEYLEQEDWKIKPYIQTSIKADARFLLLKKNGMDSQQPMYLLAVVGTENSKDIKTDLRVDKVYFAGKTTQEFKDNAERTGIPDTLPKVHRGFNQYVQAALTATTREDSSGDKKALSDLLLENGDIKVYLVGHSLGGAAATLGGARLLSMGVKPEQIEIITFGAPAVGNEAFSQQFDSVLNVTRVVIAGDPVTGLLQKAVGGYKQFGREIRWKMPGTSEKFPHKMTEYLDLAIKNYYQKRYQLEKNERIDGLLKGTDLDGQPQAYIAPVKNSLPSGLQTEFWYMEQVLQDEYRRILPKYILADQTSRERWRQKAAAQGCKWLIVPEISGYSIRNRHKGYYITFNQTVYDTDTGDIIQLVSYSTDTSNLTPLEAFIHNARSMSQDSSTWMSKD